MWKKWRTQTINWIAFVVIVAVICLAFFAGLLWNSNDLKTANSTYSQLQFRLSVTEKERLDLENKLSTVGSKSYIESRARSELLYLRPDEIRFEVENAELLDNYTPEEWKILLEQKALDDE